MTVDHFYDAKDISLRSSYANSINMSFQNMVNARHSNFQGIRLYDRLHLSEVVYGQKYRKYDCTHIYKSEWSLQNLDDVYLITFVDNIDNLVSRDDGLGFTSNPDEIQKENQRFIDAHQDSCIKNKKIININGLSISDVFAMVLRFIGE
jgi:hypothetical protein